MTSATRHGPVRQRCGALRRLSRWCRTVGPAILAAALVTPSSAQVIGAVNGSAGGRAVSINGDRLGGFVLPIEPISADIVLKSNQAWLWDVDDTSRLLLRGDVVVELGNYRFRSTEAVVWINRLPSADGVINQLAVYFDSAYDPTQRAGVGAQGNDMLVTGSTRGTVRLRCPVRETEPPPREGIVIRGEQRLALYLRRLLARQQTLESMPQVSLPAPPAAEQTPQPGASPELRDDQLPTVVSLPSQEPALPIFRPTGVVDFSGRNVTIDQQADRILLSGSILLDYNTSPTDQQQQRLTLAAERAVVFLLPGTIEGIREGERQLRAEQVEGIYLEGDVRASDGTYNIRGSRVYYDVQQNQALMADAVLRTYARNGRIPIYARADELRQLSADQWTAGEANLSTSEFFIPHLSIGAREVTVNRLAGADEVFLEAEGATFRAGTTPFFYWPKVSGRSRTVPLREVTVGGRESTGVEIITRWDLLTLLNVDTDAPIDLEGSLEGYTKRGPAAGTIFAYDFTQSFGNVDLWGLWDNGEDRTSSGLDVTPASEWRGYALWEHQTTLSDHWLFQAQASAISDETLITSWREDWFNERREFETSAYLLGEWDHTALSLLAKYNINDFISNSYLLASRAYSVDKLPDLEYQRIGDSLFGDRFTYSSEYRGTYMRLVGTDGTPNSLGVPGAAFGLSGEESIRDALFDEGYRFNYLARFDTRHELSMPIDVGPVKLSPFVSGRATAYVNDEFEAFSSDADSVRWFASAGVRANTTFQYVDNTVENRLFDLHRMRHIIEPSATFWYGYTSVPLGALPVYDQDVEAIGGAAAMNLALRSVWQTQRGGPGRWAPADFLLVNVGATLNSSDANETSPTPQWFGFRPEYSQWGDHLYGSGRWLLSDTLSFSGTGVYRLEDDDGLARGSVGMELQHTPQFATYVEYRTITIDDTELLAVGFDYQVSKKYRFNLSPQFDLRNGEFRSTNFILSRQFPDFTFLFQINYDLIADETRFAASLTPFTF